MEPRHLELLALPDELIKTVFSFFSLKEQLKLQLVNSKCMELMWRSIQRCELSSEPLLRVLTNHAKQLTGMRHLIIPRISHSGHSNLVEKVASVSPVFDTLTAYCTNLSIAASAIRKCGYKLSALTIQSYSSDTAVAQAIGQCCPSLTSLDVTNTNIGESELNCIVSGCPKLRTLRLGPRISDFSSLYSLSDLRYLHTASHKYSSLFSQFEKVDQESVKSAIQYLKSCTPPSVGVNLVVNSFTSTLLQHSIRSRAPVELVRMILKAGASLDLYDPDTQSPVQMAFDTGNLDVAKCLIDEGANLFASGKDGRNTLQSIFLRSPAASVKKVFSVIGDRIDWNQVTPHPFFLLLRRLDIFERQELVMWLLTSDDVPKQFQSIHATDEFGNSCLHYACDTLPLPEALITSLIDRGAKVNSINPAGETPLSILARHQHAPPQLITRMLAEGANPDLLDSYGRTLLSRAIDGDGTSFFLALLKHGVSVNTRSSDGLSPIAYAVLRDRSEIVNLLLTVPGTTLAPGMRLSSSTNETVLMRAVRVPFVNLALKLLQIVTPDEFSLRDHAGMNILHAAALSFDARIAEKVLVKAKEFGLLEKLMSQDSKAGSVMDAATSTKDDSVINLFRAIL